MDLGNVLTYTGMGLAVTSSLGIIKILMENDLVPKIKKVKETASNIIDVDYTIIPEVFKKKDTTEYEQRCSKLIIKDLILKNKKRKAKENIEIYKEVKNGIKDNGKYKTLAEEIFKDTEK